MIKRKPSIKDWWYTKHRIYARIRSERIHDPELHEVEQTWKYHFVRYVHVNLECCLISCILRKVIEIEIRTERMELAVKNNRLKLSSYILRRPQNFAKSPLCFWLALHRTKVRWKFCKILWPSQNVWTLTCASLVC